MQTTTLATPILIVALRHSGWALASLLICLAGAGEEPQPPPTAEPEIAVDELGGDLSSWLGKAVGPGGKINKTAYVREANAYDALSLTRRLGPDYAFFHKKDKIPEEFPEVWLRPDKGIYQNLPYQIGDPVKEAGGYSSSVMQVFYLPDVRSDPGVDRVRANSNAHHVYFQKPHYYLDGGAHPDPAMLQTHYRQAAGGQLDRPVGQARGIGLWTNCSLMVFQGGVIAATGTNTSVDRYPLFQFPKKKVPTAIALTGNNEFALVTIWDTEKFQGQVAVLAMDSSYPKGQGLHYFTWNEAVPGLVNIGLYGSMKLLGYIDLPGMAAPTAIAAWSNTRWWGYHLSPQRGLASQKERDLWRQGLEGKGGLEYHGASAGYAVVASRAESKVAFIDLRPLFQYYAQMYFTSEENYQKTRDLGVEPGKWPYTFDVASECRPRVAAMVTVKNPTAVACSLFGATPKRFGHLDGKGAQAYVARMDGRLMVYDVGGIAAPEGNGEIKPLGSLPVGRNPCCITNDKAAVEKNPRNVIIVVSRGDRRIDWVSFAAPAPQIIRTLRDKNLLDPVAADVTDNHTNQGRILEVADFMGRRITGYRYEAVLLTKPEELVGMGPDGKADIECVGSMAFPGFPFSVSCSNVN
ncbi:MAG: hypothetical protein H0W78_00420 [Planctomycetes bacterium]|nr:hypothetical protein [Planctomycetota bacterium]